DARRVHRRRGGRSRNPEHEPFHGGSTALRSATFRLTRQPASVRSEVGMRALPTLAATFVAVALLSAPARAATYYVRAAGDDTRTGKSVSDAWRTVQRVDRAKLSPGDTVLFEGGTTFNGPLWPP